MKKLSALLFLLVIVGCGGSPGTPNPPPVPLPIAWTSDGNPGVPVCTATTGNLNCKSTIDILDTTSNTSVSIPVTSMSYSAPDDTHHYSIRTSGYDGNGNPLHSVYYVVN